MIRCALSWFARLAGAASFAAAMGSFANAQDIYDDKLLFRKGAWSVVLTHNTQSGLLWCDASTKNGRGQSFSLTAYDSGQFTIFVFDNSWDIRERELRFLIDVDYSRWTMNGVGVDTSISITPSDVEDTKRFVSQVMKGNAVAVMNENGRRLAQFSLSGSYAAIVNLLECWDRIVDRDPFPDPDPFGGTSDPF